MTLLTDTKPAAGEKTSATTTKDTSTSSADKSKSGEQGNAGKDPKAAANKAAADGKPKGDDAGDTTTTADDKSSAEAGAPEVYKFKPSEDGSELGAGVQTALTEVSRELNLTNDAAQKLVDKMAPALQEQSKANIEAMVTGWKEEAENDPTIGGAKLKENLAFAAKGLALCPPELRQLLGPVEKGGTGLGNHKAVIAGFAAIGRKVSPDTKVVTGDSDGGGDPRKRPAMERLTEAYRRDAAKK